MANPTETGGSAAPAASSSSSSSEHAPVPATAILATERIYLRPHEVSDAEAKAEACNDPNIAKNMRSGFPSPYTLADAHAWIELCTSDPGPALHFAVFTRAGELAGAVGLEAPKGDKIYAGTRELGYLGTPKFWGRGSTWF
jgi:RimJ/RimL family protein N-acetyltransferase